MFRDLLRSQKGRNAVREFVAGQRGIRSIINETNSDRVRKELYRLERQGVTTARTTLRNALRSV